MYEATCPMCNIATGYRTNNIDELLGMNLYCDCIGTTICYTVNKSNIITHGDNMKPEMKELAEHITQKTLAVYKTRYDLLRPIDTPSVSIKPGSSPHVLISTLVEEAIIPLIIELVVQGGLKGE